MYTQYMSVVEVRYRVSGKQAPVVILTLAGMAKTHRVIGMATSSKN